MRLHRIRLLFLLLLGLCAAPAGAQLLFTEGVHYEEMESPQPTSTSDGVEVIEFFSYGCSHCFAFEPHLAKWAQAQPEDVVLVRIPAGLGRPAMQQLAAIFHVTEVLGVREQAHEALFEEIQVRGDRSIFRREGLAQFLSAYGVSGEALDAALESTEVQERFAASEAAAPRYGLMGVPMVVVNGRYRVRRNEAVDSYELLLEVVDYLVELERG